jgi:hypothetical protein
MTDASLALKISRTELGDCSFSVEPIMNRFRFGVAISDAGPKVSFNPDSPFGGQEGAKTLLLRGLNNEVDRAAIEAYVTRVVGEKPVKVALYGKNILIPSGQIFGDFDFAMAAIEFSTRDLMLRAILLFRDIDDPNIMAPGRVLMYIPIPRLPYLLFRADEAWKLVNPELPIRDALSDGQVFGVPAARLYGPHATTIPMAAPAPVTYKSYKEYVSGGADNRSSSSRHQGDERTHRTSRYRSRSRSRDRDRERDRDRDRERSRRYRDRSPSPDRYKGSSRYKSSRRSRSRSRVRYH